MPKNALVIVADCSTNREILTSARTEIVWLHFTRDSIIYFEHFYFIIFFNVQIERIEKQNKYDIMIKYCVYVIWNNNSFSMFLFFFFKVFLTQYAVVQLRAFASRSHGYFWMNRVREKKRTAKKELHTRGPRALPVYIARTPLPVPIYVILISWNEKGAR